MRVVGYPADTSGCAYYRILEPIAAASRAGLDASFSYVFPNRLKRRPNGAQKVVGLSDELDDVDVVVFHRPMDYRIADSIRYLRKAGIGVVVDLDDDLSAVNRETFFWQSHNPNDNAHVNWEHCRHACRYADVVTCSVPAIAKRWGFGHGVVVPNGIPPHALQMEHKGGAGIGWSGEMSSHRGDLRVVGDGVQKALKLTGLNFSYLGPDTQLGQVKEELSLERVPKTLGWTTPGEHYQNVAKIDVGIAPLADTAMASARSAVKVLEYAALGIPSVASPQSEYLRMREDGICWIAQTPEEWKLLLAGAHGFGRNLDEHLRQVVREKHTSDVTVKLAIDAWELAAKKAQRRIQRGPSPLCETQ